MLWGRISLIIKDNNLKDNEPMRRLELLDEEIQTYRMILFPPATGIIYFLMGGSKLL